MMKIFLHKNYLYFSLLAATLLLFASPAGAQTSHTLSAVPNNPALGVVYGSGTYAHGDTAVVEAFASQGCRLDHWSDNGQGIRRTFVMTADLNLTAYFDSCTYSESSVDTVWACDSLRWIDGIYYFVPTTSPTFLLANHEGCDSLVQLVLHISQSPHLRCSNDTAVAAGSPVTLWATGTEEYAWSTSSGQISTQSTVTVTPTVSTCYYIDGSEPLNDVVVNGDFSSGNTGFTSAYTYVGTAGPQALWNEGTYTVATNPNSYHQHFTTNGDHTTGTGNYLIVNANPTPQAVIWSQTTTVEPYCTYSFQAWVCALTNCSATEGPILQFRIGYQGSDTLLATPFAGPIQTSTGWVQFSALWESGPTTTATITIINQNTALSGNDFGLDDIEMIRATGCMPHDSVWVSVAHPVDSMVCQENAPLVWNGCTFNESGTQTAHLTTWEGRDSIVIMNVTIRPTPHHTLELGACDSLFAWNQYLYESGSYDFTFKNRFQCDSIVTLNLTIRNSEVYPEHHIVCENDLPYNYLDRTYPYGIHSLTDTIPLTDAYGCDSLVQLELEVHYNPLTQARLDSYDCDSKLFTLSAQFTDEANHVVWTAEPGDLSLQGQETQTTIHVSPTIPTFYTATASIPGTPCQNSLSVYVNTDVRAEAAFTYTPHTASPSAPYIELRDCSLGNINYWCWTADGEVIGQSPWLKYLYPADRDSVHLALIVAESSYGCRDTAYGTAYYQGGGIMWVPNAFTPGCDQNSLFQVKHKNIRDYSIRIYCRNGQRVFYSIDPNESWDGNDPDGRPCPMGAYTYHIVYTSVDLPGNPVRQTGSVLLIR